jgi:hypothetical protein
LCSAVTERELPIHRLMASGSRARAMRAQGMVGGMAAVKSGRYSWRRLSFWVWA